MSAEKKLKHVQRYLETTLGQHENSTMARWWKNFEAQQVKLSGLGKVLQPLDAFPDEQTNVVSRWMRKLLGQPERTKTHGELMGRLAMHLESLQNKEHREQLKAWQKALKEEAITLKQWERDWIKQVARPHQAKLGAAKVDAMQAMMNGAQHAVAQTLQLVDDLASGTRLSLDEIRARLQGGHISNLTDLDQRGAVGAMQDIIGLGKSNFRQIERLIWDERMATASNQLGPPLERILNRGLKDSMSRKLWRIRSWGILGGGVLLATALFSAFVLGKNHKKAPEHHHHQGPVWLTPRAMSLINETTRGVPATASLEADSAQAERNPFAR